MHVQEMFGQVSLQVAVGLQIGPYKEENGNLSRIQDIRVLRKWWELHFERALSR